MPPNDGPSPAPPEMILRRAEAGDAPSIARIWHQGWRDGHQGYVPDELTVVRTEDSFQTRADERLADTTVAVVESQVAGFVMVVGDEVEQVYVDRQHRGTEVARALIAEAERQIRHTGHDEAWLAIVAGNRTARNFYERSGWSDTGPPEYIAKSEQGPIKVPARRYAKALRVDLRSPFAQCSPGGSGSVGLEACPALSDFSPPTDACLKPWDPLPLDGPA